MNGGKCGKCRGRGYVQRIRGIGHDDCPKCKGHGVTQPKPMVGRSGYVPLPSGARCIVCGEFAVHNHHVAKRQRIDRLVKPTERAEQCKRDRRGVCPLCDRCHGLAEQESREVLELTAGHLHPDFGGYVAEYDLYAALPRYMQERAA